MLHRHRRVQRQGLRLDGAQRLRRGEAVTAFRLAHVAQLQRHLLQQRQRHVEQAGGLPLLQLQLDLADGHAAYGTIGTVRTAFNDTLIQHAFDLVALRRAQLPDGALDARGKHGPQGVADGILAQQRTDGLLAADGSVERGEVRLRPGHLGFPFVAAVQAAADRAARLQGLHPAPVHLAHAQARLVAAQLQIGRIDIDIVHLQHQWPLRGLRQQRMRAQARGIFLRQRQFQFDFHDRSLRDSSTPIVKRVPSRARRMYAHLDFAPE